MESMEIVKNSLKLLFNLLFSKSMIPSDLK